MSAIAMSSMSINQSTKEAVYGIIDYWLQKSVSTLMETINHVVNSAQLRNEGQKAALV